jgi:hypothetical protein
MIRILQAQRAILVSLLAGLLSVASMSTTGAWGQDFPHGIFHGPSWHHVLVRIHNRWKTDEYLNIEQGQLVSGPIEPGWYSAMWYLDQTDDGYIRLQNYWKPDEYIHIQSGNVQAGPIEPGWWSAKWTLEDVSDTPFVHIHNRWKPDQFLHNQYGSVQAGPIEPGWWSAMWDIERVSPPPG